MIFELCWYQQSIILDKREEALAALHGWDLHQVTLGFGLCSEDLGNGKGTPTKSLIYPSCYPDVPNTLVFGLVVGGIGGRSPQGAGGCRGFGGRRPTKARGLGDTAPDVVMCLLCIGSSL